MRATNTPMRPEHEAVPRGNRAAQVRWSSRVTLAKERGQREPRRLNVGALVAAGEQLRSGALGVLPDPVARVPAADPPAVRAAAEVEDDGGGRAALDDGAAAHWPWLPSCSGRPWLGAGLDRQAVDVSWVKRSHPDRKHGQPAAFHYLPTPPLGPRALRDTRGHEREPGGTKWDEALRRFLPWPSPCLPQRYAADPWASITRYTWATRAA